LFKIVTFNQSIFVYYNRSQTATKYTTRTDCQLDLNSTLQCIHCTTVSSNAHQWRCNLVLQNSANVL